MLLARPLVQSAAVPQPAIPSACCREDLKHLKAKLKKLDEKMAKDGGWLEVAAGVGWGLEQWRQVLVVLLVVVFGAAWCGCGMCFLTQLEAESPSLSPFTCGTGAKAQDLQVELQRLQEDVPALQARAADLELQLTKAQEVRLAGREASREQWTSSSC